MSEDFKQKVVEQFRTTWSSITELAKMPRLVGTARPEAITNDPSVIPLLSDEPVESMITSSSELNVKIEEKATTSQESMQVQEIIEQPASNFRRLNDGRRIDYMLQERPIEMFNEYLFALASHACYWESEDTLLLLVKEVYGVGNTIDVNTELHLTEQQQQMSSWFTQAAVAALPANISALTQKSFTSYFNFSSVMPNLTSVMNRTQNAATSTSASNNTSTNETPTSSSNPNNNNNNK